jgi:modulator of FtsH protease HflK
MDWERHRKKNSPPEEIQVVLAQAQKRIREWGTGKVTGLAILILLGLWLLSGFYVVGPGERGVVRLFGQVTAQTEPGLRYRLPWPIQAHNVVDVAQVRRAEIGFRTVAGRTSAVPQESLMLTGDENIVDVQLFVQYLAHDPVLFLFGARDPEVALRASAEVALRSVVGQNTIDYTMTEGRVDVQERVKVYLQELLDAYSTGLLVTESRLLVVDPPREVRDSFHDVVRAWEDRERLIKEADGYREDILPKARGEAFQMVREAEAYREQRVIRAEGDSARFLEFLEEYEKAKDVTRDRLYLESMERVLPQTQIAIMDGGNDGTSNVLPFLPLRPLTGDGRPAAGERR